MSTAKEASRAKAPMASDLAQGLAVLALDQEISFRLYVRVIAPVDGYVFWVRSDITSAPVFRIPASTLQTASEKPKPFKVKGSLHYSTDVRQDADEVYSANRVVFTAISPVNNLSAIAPNTMWIGHFEDKRFAFSSRSPYYRQADLHHYVGFAIYSDMETQIIDDATKFPTDPIVTNSLPAWLALNEYEPFYGFGNLTIPLYPSFLSPLNIVPPYITVDIRPELTRAVASAPTIDSGTSTHTQLAADSVRLTLWGLTNQQALDFLDCVYQYSNDVSVFGITNVPTVRDERRTQTELLTLAMKKSLDVEVSYLQHRMNDIARQRIRASTPKIYVSGIPL